MTLIEHEARVGLPRMWEHPTRTHTRRGGVVASDAYRRTHAKERRLDGKNQRNV